MNNKKKTTEGFTLIELLVVIAIIGILSAVVLASLNTARQKGQDASIQSDLNNLRSQAAIYFSANSNYSSLGSDDNSSCTDAAAGTMFADDATMASQLSAVNTANGGAGMSCNVTADGSAYAASAKLVASSGSEYCVDSTGVGTTTSSASPLGTATACPQ
jgi:prepilin-type N-terminal cleavage/methylation domain-containing protein